MIPESKIGRQIITIRLSQKLILESLAKKTDVTKGYLSKLENSEKAPFFSIKVKKYCWWWKAQRNPTTEERSISLKPGTASNSPPQYRLYENNREV